MIFGRLFDSRRKSKTLTDGSSSPSSSPTSSSSGSDSPTTSNKLKRNRTVSASTNVAKETNTALRKHLSLAVPRSKQAPHDFTSRAAHVKSEPASPPRHRAVSIAVPKPHLSRPSSPLSLGPGPERPRSTFEGARLAEPESINSALFPSASSTRSSTDARASVYTQSSSSLAGPSSPASTRTQLPPVRPRIRRGSSAPPSVAGVVRAELDADGLSIRDAHAHRPEPVLVIPREQVAEFCAEVGVWEEVAGGSRPQSVLARVPSAVGRAVFTAEPEQVVDDAVPLSASAPASIPMPLSRAASLRLTVASAPSTPRKTGPLRAHTRRRVRSLISLHHRRPVHRRKSAAPSKRSVRRHSRRMTARPRLEGNHPGRKLAGSRASACVSSRT